MLFGERSEKDFLFLFPRKFRRNFLGNKRHYVPEMRTRTKMKKVASDCARRENMPRHILFSFILWVTDRPSFLKVKIAEERDKWRRNAE